MDVREPGEETRAVEVGVHAGLKIDARAARREPKRIVEVSVVADHRPEHHLVVAALRATEPAAHPRLQEDCAAFAVPPRGRHPRLREDSCRTSTRDPGRRVDLAEKESPPARVLLGLHVALHDVHQLVIHQLVHALARRKRFERVRTAAPRRRRACRAAPNTCGRCRSRRYPGAARRSIRTASSPCTSAATRANS